MLITVRDISTPTNQPNRIESNAAPSIDIVHDGWWCATTRRCRVAGARPWRCAGERQPLDSGRRQLDLVAACTTRWRGASTRVDPAIACHGAARWHGVAHAGARVAVGAVERPRRIAGRLHDRASTYRRHANEGVCVGGSCRWRGLRAARSCRPKASHRRGRQRDQDRGPT